MNVMIVFTSFNNTDDISCYTLLHTSILETQDNLKLITKIVLMRIQCNVTSLDATIFPSTSAVHCWWRRKFPKQLVRVQVPLERVKMTNGAERFPRMNTSSHVAFSPYVCNFLWLMCSSDTFYKHTNSSTLCKCVDVFIRAWKPK